MSTVTEHIKKTKTITHYDYDAFGRRTLVQDEGGKIIRTLYDGLSFDIIREQETFADGYFTNTNDTGIAWSPVSEGDGSRYRYIGDDTPASKEQNGYSVAASNRASSRVALYANGQAVGVNRSSNYASSERSYFGTDLMGTVRSATTDSGSAEYYEYDVFGKPYGETVSDYAYTGKPYDPVTGMYNYGYRDYEPQTARFTTIDPIRDGSNWFAYCNNEPVNFLDAWGLWSDSMEEAINKNLGQTYVSKVNDCDIWAEKVEKQAHPDSTLKKDWGAAASTNASGHKSNLKDNLTNDMSLGTSIVIQTVDGKAVHAFLACLNEDGTVDVAQMTNNPEGGKPSKDSPGYSEKFSYDSQQDFIEDGWGELKFYNLGDEDDYKKNK
jgi:RHS repeat-associated protein